MKPAEKNYGTTEKECLAIIYAVLHFRPYLYGREVTLISDHEPLKWIDSVKPPVQRLIRWRTRLREYQYKFLHKPGRLNVNADALSRNPPLEEAIAFPTSASAKLQGNARQATSTTRERPLGSKNKTPSTDLNETKTAVSTIAERVRARHNQIEPPKIQKPLIIKKPQIIQKPQIKQLTKKPAPSESSTSKQPPPKPIRPNKFTKQVTFNVSNDSGSEKEVPPVARKRNSGFGSLLPNTPPITRQQSSNEDSNSEEENQQQRPVPNKNIKEVERPNSSGSDGLASMDEYWWDETKLRHKTYDSR